MVSSRGENLREETKLVMTLIVKQLRERDVASSVLGVFGSNEEVGEIDGVEAGGGAVVAMVG